MIDDEYDEYDEQKEWMKEWDDMLSGLPIAGTYLRWRFQALTGVPPITAHELLEAAALVRRMAPDTPNADLTLAEADVLEAKANVQMAKARRWMLEQGMSEGEGGPNDEAA